MVTENIVIETVKYDMFPSQQKCRPTRTRRFHLLTNVCTSLITFIVCSTVFYSIFHAVNTRISRNHNTNNETRNLHAEMTSFRKQIVELRNELSAVKVDLKLTSSLWQHVMRKQHNGSKSGTTNKRRSYHRAHDEHKIAAHGARQLTHLRKRLSRPHKMPHNPYRVKERKEIFDILSTIRKIWEFEKLIFFIWGKGGE